MTGEKKHFPQPQSTYKVYAPTDLTRKWFVYWGKPRQRVYGHINQHHTYAERMTAAQALIDTLMREELSKPTTHEAETAIRKYLADNARRWRLKTQQAYTSITNVFFAWLGPRDITEATIAAFLLHIQQTKHGITYNKYLAQLKRVLCAVGYPASMFRGVASMRCESTPAKYFQTYQARRLADLIQQHNPQLHLFISFSYYCFIRPSELRVLQVGDLLLDEGEIRIPGHKSKNRKSQYVVIPNCFLPQLQHLAQQAPADYIFPSPLDPSQPIGKNTMYHQHKQFLDELNFGPGYSLYSWKHTGAVMAAKAGVHIKELQLQLRHASLEETDKYLRQMGVKDMHTIRDTFPVLGARKGEGL